MKTYATLTFAFSIALSACTPDLDSAATEPTAVDPLIGKRLVSGDIVFLINADGTMGGTLRGEPIVGTYEATATESCSVYSSPEVLTGREYCSTPVITGNTVVFNRRDGSQSPVNTIEG